ncbi:MAG: GldG family protein [Verrucomicrobiota bacterium]
MNKTTKIQWQAALYSAVGIVVVAVLLVAVNMIADELNLRADFTDEKLYTLSDGTRTILEELDTSVNVRFYYSKSAADMPVQLKSYAGRVQDLLQEYRRASNGLLEIDKFDPQPDSEAEDSARLDGIRGRSVATGRSIYLGIAVHCLDETVTLPYLDPSREAQLEYELTRAIHRVTHPEKPTVGLLSSLPVAGSPGNPMMGQSNQEDAAEPWLLVKELEKQFEVTQLDVPETIPDTVDVLLLIHPKNLSEATLFAIDQYLLGGGSILAFLDPMSIIDLQLNPQGRFSQPQPSDLTPLLDTWGVQFDTDSLVIDRLYKSTIPGPDGQMQEYLPFLDLGPDAVNSEHPAVAELERILLPFGGHFGGSGSDDLTRTVLMHTSEKSGTVPKFMAQVGGNQMAGNIKNEGGQKALAIQLDGRFETAFPDGQPTDKKDSDSDSDSESEESADFLKQTLHASTVVLVGDADMLHDRFCVNQSQTIFGPASTPISDNLALAQNLAELLSGADELIGIRSRGALNRPFKVIQEKTAEARAKYQETIAELEAELAEAENRLQKLQLGKSENDKYYITPEQEEEIERFEKKRAAINRQLKTLRRSLRKEIVALENQLKWLNIAAMPAVVVLIGLGFSLHRKRRMANK